MASAGTSTPRFHWLDYVVFAVVLLASVLIGVVYAFRKVMTAQAYLLGNRKVGIIPVWLSLYVSFFSAVSLIGIPAEVYTYGISYWVYNIAAALGIVLALIFFVPVFYRLRITSVFEYLEIRFNRVVRVIASLMFCIKVTIFLAIVLYAPALAFSQVSGLSLWVSILAVGLAGTLYTTLGGLRAVVWTDVFQALVICGGLAAVTAVGTVRMGGFDRIWDIAQQGERLNFFVMDGDPRTRHSFWNFLFGDLFLFTYVYGVSQQEVQRYAAISSLTKARFALFLMLPTALIIQTVLVYLGLLVYVTYSTCDPLLDGRITNRDQIYPLMILQMFSDYNGVAGLLVASVFCAALSTLSSGINSMAAVVLEDFLRPCYHTLTGAEVSDRGATWVAKTVSLMFGMAIIALACAGSYLDQTVVQMAYSAFGILGGPLLGVFMLGIFFPCANSFGAVLGLVPCAGLMIWMGTGAAMTPRAYRTLPMSVLGCAGNITQVIVQNISQPETVTYGYVPVVGSLTSNNTVPPEEFYLSLDDLYLVSYRWYPLIGTLFTIFLGLVFSVITGGCCRQHHDHRVLYTCKEHCCGKKTYYYNVQQHEKEADYTYLPMTSTAQQNNVRR